jgi:hypothetical protein
MDQELRNRLRNVVTQCRKLLEESISQELEGKYAMFAKKDQVTADPNAPMTHLSDEEQSARKDILDHFNHIKARGFKPKEALDQLIREIAFTHLNRFCAYKMMEAREVYIGEHKFRDAVGKGVNSKGVMFYLADHPEDERLFNTGHQDVAYRHFLDWLGGLLSEEIGVLFNPNDPANRLYPRQTVLDDVLDLLNSGGIKPDEAELREAWSAIWSQDETIGWVYQYFTPKEFREAARDPKKGGSQAPRNSYELAFRNQFFTPRYVVEFLTDNTLGRIWYEMQKGQTKLKNQCRYLVRRPTEIFLKEGEQSPKEAADGQDALSQEELLKLSVHIPHRPKKDPRHLTLLDPACGSGHFLLYCFDLLFTIYQEAYVDPQLGPGLKETYPTLSDLMKAAPGLILAHNIHGIDIDLRCTQIAALALWLRSQRAFQEMGLKKDRPNITRSNFVCAEPMPGETSMLQEFVVQLEPRLLGQLAEVVFDKMKLAGEAGSLLKIEEEIHDAVAQARKQWLTGPISIQQSLFDEITPVAQQQRFDFSGVTDTQFFEQAEAKVVEALRNYAEKAHNGQQLQRRLFSDDAVRGFAFVDVCHKRYDVVLMNPPFGEPSKTAASYVTQHWKSCSADILQTFVARCLLMLSPRGMMGVISARTGFFLGDSEPWRRDVVFRNRLHLFADLGLGVLDDALVEVAAYVVERSASASTPVLTDRQLATREKQQGLEQAVYDTATGGPKSFQPFDQRLLSLIPDYTFAYWAPQTLLRRYADPRSFASVVSKVRQGLATADDFRFARLAWEVAPNSIGRHARWQRFSKGGEYSPCYDDIHLLVDWKDNGNSLKEYICQQYPYLNGNWSFVIKNESLYFQPAVTYTVRTASAFTGKILPDDCIFSHNAQCWFNESSELLLATIGFFLSRFAQYYLELAVGGGDSATSFGAARRYTTAAVESIPSRTLDNLDTKAMSSLVKQLFEFRLKELSGNETTCDFTPPLWSSCGKSLVEWADHQQRQSWEGIFSALDLSLTIDQTVSNAAVLSEAEMKAITAEIGPHPATYSGSANPEDIVSLLASSDEELVATAVSQHGPKRYLTKKTYFVDRRIEILCHTLGIPPAAVKQVVDESQFQVSPKPQVAALLSQVLGFIFGRWDIRYSIGEKQAKLNREPFAAIPACQPGALQGNNALPLIQALEGYPLRVCWDGILIDDADHTDDIIRRARDVFDVLWPNRADSIEGEVCEILNLRELRDYFRKPGKGGFWDDHLSRYSKSRRNAPIYWLLQSSKKNYGIWLYYHRLDRDLLFKALVNYVEPKIRLETSRIETLRSQKAVAGGTGKEGKRLAKDMERQEDFLAELQDFEDKLRRAANLHLEPDLNDGVVLNIAPLHELVPWKDAKSYWDELLAGKYEWSSIGKQLRQKGLVK